MQDEDGEAELDASHPRHIDRYELLKKLATGGMAEIFLAKQSGLEGFEKVVVLKRILSHLAQDEEFVSMFLDEARIAAKLSHPNIVQIYDLGKADSSFYIAMEYVSGRNVQHLIHKAFTLRTEKIPVEHVCRVIAGVCDGLHYAHSRKDFDGKQLNIIHRDISPQNVLVSFAGGVKVVDFGIAKASTQLAQTRAGVLKGKYAYMSPEQVRGSKIDARSDLFAVGLVMYEMLTGVRAFERESSLKTLKAIVQEKPVNPRELNPEVPMEVVKLLSKALEKNPDRRYKSAQEMQLALEDYLEASPKKSNNVRLSRYMYDLFDDELNSVDGTLVVKGIGEVIIPQSAGVKLVPRVEEEIDSKTLSAALLPAAPEEKPAAPAKDAGARVVRNEAKPTPKPAANPQDAPAKAVADAPTTTPQRTDQRPVPNTQDENSDDDDGKTIPAFDLEDYERKRAEMGKGQGGQGPDPDDKTAAGVVPQSVPGGRTVDPDRERQAAALLAKVEAMARGDALQTATGLPAASGMASQERFDATREGPLTNPEQAQLTMEAGGLAEPRTQALDLRELVPPREPRPPSQPTRSSKNAPARSPAQPRLPAAFVGLVAATVTFSLLALGGLAAILLAFPSMAAGRVSGVLVVTSDPPGARVTVDGVEALQPTPTQVAVTLDGPHVVVVTKDGHKDAAPETVTFKAGESSRELKVVLTK